MFSVYLNKKLCYLNACLKRSFLLPTVMRCCGSDLKHKSYCLKACLEKESDGVYNKDGE